MNRFINENVLWFAPIFSFALAQFMKYVIYAIQYKVLRKERLTGAGGMPSSHSSGVCTLIVVMGYIESTNSAVFAISLILGLIVMYDAAGVRRAAGLHAKVINMLKKSIDEIEQVKDDNQNNNTNEDEKNAPQIPEKDLKEFVGHTPLEVFCGAILGIVIGFLFVI